MSAGRNAIDITCPTCYQPRDVECRGSRMGRYHATRISEAARLTREDNKLIREMKKL